VGWTARKTPASGEVFFLDSLYRTYHPSEFSGENANFPEGGNSAARWGIRSALEAVVAQWATSLASSCWACAGVVVRVGASVIAERNNE
jgi:hypothetical protein